MAANTDIALPKDTWTLITSGDVTGNFRCQAGGGWVLLKATADATEPTDDAGAIRLGLYDTIAGTLDELFPGVSSAVRVYAKALEGSSTVSVSWA